jgi:DNA polymerase-3 subunit gamma/tau
MQRARGRSISIKTDSERSANEVQAETSAPQEEEQKGPQEVFSTPAFEQAWRDFLGHIAHRKSIHGMLVAHSPELKNLTEVHFTLANNTQVGYLQSVKQELLNYLREKLNNYAISLHSRIEETTSEKRPYTGEEHYKAMLEINPLLDKLRKAFDAELE